MSKRIISELIKDIERGNVVFLLGTGVSIASAKKGNSSASWIGLIRNGIDYINEKDLAPDDQWYDDQIDNLEKGKRGRIKNLLLAGQEIVEVLGGTKGGQYKRWIKESVGDLELGDPSVIQAILDLGGIITTTNYDSLIEQHVKTDPVSWMEPDGIIEILRNEKQGVIHWHGYFKDTESVILGQDSYFRIKNDLFTQYNLRSIFLTKSLVFIGVKDGLSDPNFGPIREWMIQVLEQSTHQHYFICLESEFEEMKSPPDPIREKIFKIPYGKDHNDYSKLAPFLRSLRTGSKPPLSSKRERDLSKNSKIQNELLKVLFLNSNPERRHQRNFFGSSAARELEIIDKMAVESSSRKLSVVSANAESLSQLRSLLLVEKPTIIHFSGDSLENPVLLSLTSEQKEIAPGKALTNLFSLIPSVECIVFSACSTSQYARFAVEKISYAIAIEDNLEVDTAFAFFEGFYSALAAGRSIIDAYKFGDNAVCFFRDVSESEKPKIFQK